MSTAIIAGCSVAATSAPAIGSPLPAIGSCRALRDDAIHVRLAVAGISRDAQFRPEFGREKAASGLEDRWRDLG